MYLKIAFALLCLVLGASARPDRASRNHVYGDEEPPEYEFSWVVKHDYYNSHYGHRERREGDNTRGAYFVFLPDGRTQKVSYYVSGNSGFVAEVSYEGEAVYPEPQPSYN